MAGAPYVTIFGPDKHDTMYFRDPHGNKIARFAVRTNKHSKPNLEIFRVMPNGMQSPFATATFSSWSSTMTLSIQGQEVKVKLSMEGMSPAYEFQGPMGKLAWKAGGWGDSQELWDKQGIKLANYKYNSMSSEDPMLQIFVRADDYFIDLVVMAALTLYKAEKKDTKTVMKIVEGVAGV